MASGDTKTESYLRAAAEGTRADLPSDSCCNTKTQNLILGVANRIMDVEDEVEEIKNNPDVVDIVDTYADLQSYDTQHLTENDIIRVLQDETHDGNSTYYRFTKNPDTWTFIGEIAAGGELFTKLTTADYNYPVNNPDGILLSKLDPGLYAIDDQQSSFGLKIYTSENSVDTWKYSTFFIGTKTSSYNPNYKYIVSSNQYNLCYADLSGTPYIGTADSALLRAKSVVNNLNSSETKAPLSAAQGKVLGNRIKGSLTSPPTTSTAGEVGSLLATVESGTGHLYICTEVNGSTYTWQQLV